MPNLLSLKFHSCHNLVALPDNLLQRPALQKLVINDCSILKEKYLKETGKEWYSISHISFIQIHSSVYVNGMRLQLPHAPSLDPQVIFFLNLQSVITFPLSYFLCTVTQNKYLVANICVMCLFFVLHSKFSPVNDVVFVILFFFSQHPADRQDSLWMWFLQLDDQGMIKSINLQLKFLEQLLYFSRIIYLLHKKSNWLVMMIFFFPLNHISFFFLFSSGIVWPFKLSRTYLLVIPINRQFSEICNRAWKMHSIKLFVVVIPSIDIRLVSFCDILYKILFVFIY